MKIIPELVVDDVKKAVNFYQTFLDFELVDKVEVKDSYFWAKMESKDKSTEIMFTLLTNVNDEIPEMKKRHDAGRIVISVPKRQQYVLFPRGMYSKFPADSY